MIPMLYNFMIAHFLSSIIYVSLAKILKKENLFYESSDFIFVYLVNLFGLFVILNYLN